VRAFASSPASTAGGCPRRGALSVDTRVLVKIDVEGTEDEVLAHAGRFLARPHVDVLCEVLAGVPVARSARRRQDGDEPAR
jgi:hypothetical protein